MFVSSRSIPFAQRFPLLRTRFCILMTLRRRQLVLWITWWLACIVRSRRVWTKLMLWTLMIFSSRRLSCSPSTQTCLLSTRSASVTLTLTSIRIPTAFSMQLPSFWHPSIVILWLLAMMTSPFIRGAEQTSKTSWRSRKTMRKQL